MPFFERKIKILILLSTTFFFIAGFFVIRVFFTKSAKLQDEKKSGSASATVKNAWGLQGYLWPKIKTPIVISDNVKEIKKNIFLREIVIDSSQYRVVNLAGVYQGLVVEGFSTKFGYGTPLLPQTDYRLWSIDVPQKSVVNKVQISEEDPVFLGKMNIPCANSINNMSNEGGDLYDCSVNYPVFPKKQKWEITELFGKKMIGFDLFPAFTDMKTKETKVFKKIRIQILYDISSSSGNSAPM